MRSTACFPLVLLIAGLMLSCATSAPVLPTATPTPVPPTSSPGSSSVPSESAQMPQARWQLVVIGDSSLWGLGEAFASRIESDVGVQVVLGDFALPSPSARTVLKAILAEEPPTTHLAKELADALRQAEVVVMFVNPLGSIDPQKPLNLASCFASREPASCSPETFEQYSANLKAIWAKILELRGGQPTILRATDVYNPFVSPWKEAGVFEDCTKCWENMSHAARLAAEAYNIPFLSRYDAFNGTGHSEDPREKGYIRSDGEHPTELASQFTADLLFQMGYDPVSPPTATIAPLDALEPVPFLLAEPGPYRVGVREFSAQAASRDGRQVGIRVWYPALWPEDAAGKRTIPKAEPDRSGAPYPMIVSSARIGSGLAPWVVTHGFVWAGVTRNDTYARMNEQMIDQPLDIHSRWTKPPPIHQRNWRA
jgi:hypothetical protein